MCEILQDENFKDDNSKYDFLKDNHSEKYSEIKDGGILYICATPIGNLGDTTFRLIETLKNADFILAEDTRKLRKILTKFNIRKNIHQIISYTDFSSREKIEHIINYLNSGKNAALVTEAGMPAIQDPGFRIIKECIDNNINITVIPGPNAALSAVVLSGLPTDNFLFIGFLPKKISKVKERLQQLNNLPYTLIFYESPRRTFDLLELMLSEIGNRKCCLARELTKIHEEIIRGKISDVINIIKDRFNSRSGKQGICEKENSTKMAKTKISLKGEIVIVVEGADKDDIKPDIDNELIRKEYSELVGKKYTRNEALKLLKDKYGIKKQKLYNITLKNMF